MATLTVLSNKKYKVVNPNTSHVLGMLEDKTVAAQEWNTSDNQKWLATQKEGNWAFRNEAEGGYLGIKGQAYEGAHVVGTSQAFQWKLDEKDQSSSRLFVLNTEYNLDIKDGSLVAGAPLIVWRKSDPGINQIWRFEEAKGRNRWMDM